MTTILGSGHLSASSPGVMTGKVTFTVRGAYPMQADLPQRDADNRLIGFRLRVGRDECQVEWCDVEPPEAAMPRHEFHSFIRLEGYEMMVRAVRGDAGLSVRFYDSIQPLPIPKEWGEAA